ncbi:hypothetical protein BD560DRAFT_369608 [Blakeslea trispora]|nr:hypothetical protein BD560DRAFT_369608 [Blakeslea trispora]
MTLIVSSKSLLKKLQFKKLKSKKPDFISCLPKELLVCIYQQLETPSCTSAFAATSRLFRQVAIQPHSRAAWIVCRLGPRYALYYALLYCPAQCTGQFINTLIHLGAQLPFCLLQALLKHYGKEPTKKNKPEPFLEAIQHLPFDGYASLIQKGHQLGYRAHKDHDLDRFITAMVKGDDLTLETIISSEWFLLSSFVARKTPIPYQSILEKPKLLDIFAPMSEFDPLARSDIWEVCLSILFEESFRSSEMTARRSNQLKMVSTLVSYPTTLLGPGEDRRLFCQVFAHFFTKYPRGYCQAYTMHHIIKLLYQYAQPVSSFDIPMALEHIVEAQIGREDTLDHIRTHKDTPHGLK